MLNLCHTKITQKFCASNRLENYIHKSLGLVDTMQKTQLEVKLGYIDLWRLEMGPKSISILFLLTLHL